MKMIQANELRFGNWMILHRSKAIGGDYHYKLDNGVTLDEIRKVPESVSPIPLTPEILKNCGFTWQPDPFKGWYSPAIKYWKMRIWESDEHEFLFSTNEFNAVNLTDLHQLQNLYFALTGKELEYKP